MKITFSILASLSFLSLAACGGGGGGPAADAETPEGEAYAYREAVMHLIADKMGTIGGMAREEIPVDEAVFTKATADLVALSGMILEGFEVQGIATGSRSLPEIWTEWDDFQQKANDLATAAAGLAQAATTGGFAAAQGLVQGTAGNCGGCHRVYRERTE